MRAAGGSSHTLTIYTKAGLAIVIPAAAWLFAGSALGLAIGETAHDHAWATAALSAAILGLLILELMFAVILFRLVRARFDLNRYAQLHTVALANRRVVRFRMTAIVASTLLTFLVAEAAFRVLDITPPGPRRPRTKRRDIDYTRNALGIREDWDDLPPADDRLRVAVMGDSFVFGRGVEQGETFCHLLEHRLVGSSNRGVVTINLGEPGTAPGSQLVRFAPLIEHFEPDLLVHVLYPNDLGVELHKYLREIYIIRDDDTWTGSWSYVLRYAERQVRHWIAWRRTIAYFQGGATRRQRERSWQILADDLDAVRKLCADRDITYCLVLFPWLHRLEDYMLHDVHDRVAEIAGRMDVAFLDLLPLFEGHSAGDLRISDVDSHPNPVAHAIAADAIAGFLKREVLPRSAD